MPREVWAPASLPGPEAAEQPQSPSTRIAAAVFEHTGNHTKPAGGMNSAGNSRREGRETAAAWNLSHEILTVVACIPREQQIKCSNALKQTCILGL
jgi:hypothetical protein